jgi:hypothetical protein
MVWQQEILNFFGSIIFIHHQLCFYWDCYFFNRKIFKISTSKFHRQKKRKKVQNIVTIVSVLILVPSVYFAYSLYQEQKFRQEVNEFLEKEITEKEIL